MYEFQDKEGNPITVDQWTNLQTNDSYKVIKQESFNGLFISTVWLGIPHIIWNSVDKSFTGYFETMIFDENDNDIGMWRYETLKEAEEGHQKIVEDVKIKGLPLGMD